MRAPAIPAQAALQWPAPPPPYRANPPPGASRGVARAQPLAQAGHSGRGALQAKLVEGQSRYYPNLNPSAAIPVEPREIFRLHNFFDRYRLERGSERAAYVPNMKYIFVRTADGEILMHPRYRHPAIAGGKPVLYAGEAYFNNGTLEWWSNGSGNYRPDAAHAEQADLPMERFYSFDQILKGVHKRAEDSQSRSASSQNAAPR